MGDLLPTPAADQRDLSSRVIIDVDINGFLVHCPTA